jgi:hypothetical protein
MLGSKLIDSQLISISHPQDTEIRRKNINIPSKFATAPHDLLAAYGEDRQIQLQSVNKRSSRQPNCYGDPRSPRW